METVEKLKAIASAAVADFKDDLIEVSTAIWQNPELHYQEYKAHELLTNFLDTKGFRVERSYTGIKTAFRATYGSGRPNICVICEYDALPGIGHACGHNLIAEAGLAAGLGIKAALQSSETQLGRVTVLGTPAEEAGSGKVQLLKNGAFSDVDVALMIHPSSFTCVYPHYLAIACYTVTYTGRAAHAAAFPWEGVNALDAAILAYTMISQMRQQLKPECRVHGVIKEGGVKPNIIPEKAVLEYMIRAPNRKELAIALDKVLPCFNAAAVATGCQVDVDSSEPQLDNVLTNDTIARLYEENLKKVGVPFERHSGASGHGSTDMGNVSHTVPGMHPKFMIGSGHEVAHSAPFARVANLPESHIQTQQFARAMAFTGIDFLTHKELVEEAWANFRQHCDDK